MLSSKSVVFLSLSGCLAISLGLFITAKPAPAQPFTPEQISDLTGIDLNTLPIAGLTWPEWKAVEDVDSAILGQANALSNNLAIGPGVALTDIFFGNAEGGLRRTISGSYEQGFAVPCQQSCAHIELGAPYAGYQWVSGLSQQVRGGHGALGSVNNGLEPTGRHPFGAGFKVVVLEVDEALGTAETGLYFRACVKEPIDLGCTPYFIGPVPWLTLREEGLTFL